MKFDRLRGVSKRGSVDRHGDETVRYREERFCTTTPVRLTSSAGAQRDLHAVVHLDGGVVDVGPTSKVHVIVSVAVRGGGGLEVEQALDPGELLLDRRGDGARKRLGARAGERCVIVTVGGAISGLCATGST